jgi:tetratricopeptide (TPR) repeat protein
VSPAQLVDAREAYQQRDWLTARTAFLAAQAASPLAADDQYALASCAWWLGDLATALPAMQQAYRQFLDEQRPELAALVALDVGYPLALRGELAQGGGWLSRARRLLQDRPEQAAHGYLIYLDFEDAFGGAALERAREVAQRVQQMGVRYQEPTLVALGVLGLGRVALRQGNVDEGMALLDEAMVAAVSDQLDPGWAGNIYCHLMAACFEIADLRRAGEWTQATARWCEQMPGAGPFLGICRVHRAQVLHVRGDWERAEQELAQARLLQARQRYQEMEVTAVGDIIETNSCESDAHGKSTRKWHAVLR